MGMILLFLAKLLDKHGITLVHITYPPLPFSSLNHSNLVSRKKMILSIEVGTFVFIQNPSWARSRHADVFNLISMSG